MSSDWTSTTVGELCDHFGAELQTGPFGSQLHSYDYRNEGVPVVPTEAINDGRINPDALPRISFEKARELSRHALKPGDILFARRGAQATGKTALARDCDEGAICGTGAIRLRTSKSTVCDPSFLAACLSAKDTVSWIRHHAIGATMPNLNEGIIRSIPIRLAPVHDQKAIAHILGTLDDKIELNRKTNETLEAMARALFKSWFVDFDPVRAKAEGLSTGLPDEISELFPDSFEESRWGEIPQGWECLPLADRALYLSRGISPAYCEEGGVLVLNQKCVRDSRVCFEKARRHDTAKKGIVGREVRQYDALVNSTGVGTLGRVAMMPACSEVVVVDSHVTVVRGGNDWESFFISSTLVNRQDEIEALGEGSTGQTELSRAVLGSLPMTFPPSQFISAFFDCICPVQGKIEANDQSSIALACIRDTLLPKLISGELRIPDAERLLEEAGV